MAGSYQPACRDHHPDSAELVGRVESPARWDARGHPRGGLDAIPEAPSVRADLAGQALVSLSEFRPSDDEPLEGLDRDFPPRPRRFETTELRSSQVRKGCDQPRAQLFRFREANRFLYAWVMFGRDLSTGLRTKAEAVLSTLEVDPPE